MKVEWEEFGRAIHTAMRKVCDSEPTTILYNLIQVLPDGAWVAFSRYVAKRVKAKRPRSRRTLQTAVWFEWVGAYDNIMYDNIMRDGDRAHRVEFYLLSKLAGRCTEGDWEGMCAYLVNE